MEIFMHDGKKIPLKIKGNFSSSVEKFKALSILKDALSNNIIRNRSYVSNENQRVYHFFGSFTKDGLKIEGVSAKGTPDVVIKGGYVLIEKLE